MRILSITVGGFRNIEKTTFELGGIVGLVSANNYGKTNVLDAISFAIDFMQASLRERSNMMGVVGCMPLSPKLADDCFTFAIELEDPDLGEYRFVRYGFSFAWAKDDGGGRSIVDETLEINSKRGGLWSSYLKRSEGKFRASHDTRYFRSMNLEGSQLAIDVLTSIDDIDINPAIRLIKQVSCGVCDSLDAAGRYSSVPFEFVDSSSEEQGVMFDDDDLPRALYRLKLADPERFETFRYAVLALFPDFEDISVNAYEVRQETKDRLGFFGTTVSPEGADGLRSDGVPFHIRDELYKVSVSSRHLNQPVNISMMSTGTKRMIWLIANVVIAGRQGASLIGVEEIETSIHPRMIQELLEIIDENLGNTGMIVTSHSPYLIQYLKPRCLYVGVPNEEGIASFKKVRDQAMPSLMKAARERGFGFGEYLFSLMSSDEDGALVLSSYLED